ncbi:MAG: hypothetical protein B6D62_04140 [Candidatus Cloacimonas sp. 4484_275]|nr:MAG: hypothetical protein B6D62_04140 [Candidatus Cloacimonas sp. 4484_275]
MVFSAKNIDLKSSKIFKEIILHYQDLRLFRIKNLVSLSIYFLRQLQRFAATNEIRKNKNPDFFSDKFKKIKIINRIAIKI